MNKDMKVSDLILSVCLFLLVVCFSPREGRVRDLHVVRHREKPAGPVPGMWACLCGCGLNYHRCLS